MFFDNWYSLLRILVVGAASYVVLIVYIRLFGKRTLSKMSAFDLVVTVALGSTLATVIISKDVKLVEGSLPCCCCAACSSWPPSPRFAGAPPNG